MANWSLASSPGPDLKSSCGGLDDDDDGYDDDDDDDHYDKDADDDSDDDDDDDDGNDEKPTWRGDRKRRHTVLVLESDIDHD